MSTAKKTHALEPFFTPKSIAIIGASAKEGKIGNVIFSNFVRSFRGKLYPINTHESEIFGIKCYKSVKEVKEEIEAAVIAIPAAAVPQALKECGQKKVKAATIISAGFAEIGNEKLQKELEKAIKQFPQTKVIGPNCLGILDTKSGVDMLFLPNERLGRPRNGVVSFISQSGALGSAILDWDAMKGYGINKFVSYGNAVQVDESQLLDYFAEDESTKVITAYFEGVKNGKRFFEALKKACEKKPVIVLKGGSSEKGAEAVKSHTASMAGNHESFIAALKQCNAIIAESMEEVFDYARVFTTEPKPKGSKVQIITDGGGYGVLATDALSKFGLELAEMSEERKAVIKQACPNYAVVKNPIDLTGDANNERYKVALEQAMLDENVDAIFTILLLQVPNINEGVVEEMQKISLAKTKPLIFISAGGAFSEKQRRKMEEKSTSTFQSPLDAAKSLNALIKYYTTKEAREKAALEPEKPKAEKPSEKKESAKKAKAKVKAKSKPKKQSAKKAKKEKR
ncbi:MAG: CoA-binding protein [Candidatus Diapherotrites archaeon]|uniref:CoA-binding protein n=2 Tax=Candidatus Iainarchaeum sp. TaxID=3101447 RepID=A0A8T4KUQ3_9ARCH|nr:CoA-binding protein [Candidatus Diapherotrites archaeon]